MRKTLAEWLADVRGQLGADRKKSVVLGGLCIVLLGAVAHLFMGKSGAPAEAAAVATAVVSPAPQPSGPRIRPVPQQTPLPVARPRTPEPPRSTRPGLSQSLKRDAIRVDEMPRSLERDLFSVPDWSVFPPAYGGSSAGNAGDAAGEGAAGHLWSRLAEVIASRRIEQQGIIAKLSEELAALHLQATLTGSTPTAYVSGRLVREGDTINGFSVVHIADRRVTLRKSGYTRRLSMP
ncbi:MAG: hypothetical protein ACE5F9_01820 [Phycisphaerae bacterium]